MGGMSPRKHPPAQPPRIGRDLGCYVLSGMRDGLGGVAKVDDQGLGRQCERTWLSVKQF